ncbi:MAG: 3'-5' exonuclease [Kiritimatiellae bacterium]|jgi:DNA polymerase-3 subunit epsilon|nr:3'-5' exonuclease [Kiritimatiellia bacterium]
MSNLKLIRPLVVFDIESTGVSPRKDRIIELAAIKLMPNGEEISKCWLMNPTVPIPPETTAIHGISDEIVKDCPTFADKAKEIFEFFRDCDLSGFNADRFDIPCLEEEFARVGMAFAPSARKHVDVQRIYHKKEPRDLSAAVRFYLGRNHDGAHGAEADTRATLEVLKAQMAKYTDLPQTVDEMDEYLVPHDPLNADRAGTLRWKDGELTINFGKKKGESLKKLLLNEPNYLKWILKGDFDTEVRMIIKDLLDNGRLPPAPQ